MARKEINVFGTSFLDLLSGALAAVIILFVIVPKMSAADQEALREIREAEIQVTEIAEMIRQLEQSIPQEQFDAIMQQIEDLQQTIENLRNQVTITQQQLQQTQQENEQLQQQIEQQQQRITELEDQLNQNRQASLISRYFGISADLGVVCMWHENVDIDLHITNLSNNEPCDYAHPSRSWGRLNEDVRSRNRSTDDRYELFYQNEGELKTGRYRIAIKMYSGNVSSDVDGMILLYPGKQNEVKIPYGPISFTRPGQMVNIGILTVTENNITLQQ